MEFPPDLALRLVKHRVPIVAANCMARRFPYFLTARDEQNKEVLTLSETTGLQKVSRAGTGIMLIHCQIFKALSPPWFEYGWNAETRKPTGEDFVFCDKARQAGFDIYVDHDLSKLVSHHGTFGFHPLMRSGFLEAEAEIDKSRLKADDSAA